ncbi:probable chitinase 2 [Ctenocephalides felis]|uniref:probable chitinase 2 n=1 Tax=Ctenocephalides felis TaxID=7515 RepID=UPI000E6E44BD|nr:probable chitinase 2 [Ctenocephalides felis]
MDKMRHLYAAFVAVAVSCLFLQNVAAKTGPEHGKVVVCYVATWAVYRPGLGSYALEDIDSTLCTHLIYSFAGLNATTDSLKSLDPWQDLKDDYGKGGYERITALRGRAPHLKVSLAVGGWTEGSENYSKMAADPDRRRRFIHSALEFIKKYNFDGLDLDWEFPGKRGGAPEDKRNFVLLVKELREEFDKRGYILTAALGASRETIDLAYDIKQLKGLLDFFHLMCYDYHGAWDGRVGGNAPIKGGDLSIETTVDYLLQLGAPPEKLVLGIPFYGRTFVVEQHWDALDGSEVPLGLSAKSAGFRGPYTREDGFMGYNEVRIKIFRNNNNRKRNF